MMDKDNNNDPQQQDTQSTKTDVDVKAVLHAIDDVKKLTAGPVKKLVEQAEKFEQVAQATKTLTRG